MYAVTKNGVFDGYADSVLLIKLHINGCYIPCSEDEAEGFCAKIARETTTEDGEPIAAMVDTVYRFDGKTMHGNEPTGGFEQIGGAAQLTNSENAVTALVGQSITPQRAAELRPVIEAAAVSLSDGEAAKAVELFPAWAYPVSYAVGDRVGDGGKLYKCQQAHTSQEGWNPAATPAMWVVVDVEHAGTMDDPIPAAAGMEYEYGKYYLDQSDGKTYLCERTGEAAGGKIVLQYLPHEVVGQYFTEVAA